jgi:hypothetical protein
MPVNALTADERQHVMQVANEARFSDEPPAKIVPTLVDGGMSPANRPPAAHCALRVKQRTLAAHDGSANHPCGQRGAPRVG